MKKDWYLEKVIVEYGNRRMGNPLYDKLKSPFEIIAVTTIKSKNIWTGEISEKIVYDLCYLRDDKPADIRENIEEERIFSDINECFVQASDINKIKIWG